MRQVIALVFHYSLDGLLADEGTPRFDEVPGGYRLDLVSSVARRNGVLERRYRRHR